MRWVTNRLITVVAAGVLGAVLLFSPRPAAAGETAPCAECGMATTLTGRFTARIIQGKDTLFFCDIGDLIVFLNRQKMAEFRAEVRDFPTGEWLDARQAFYAREKKLYLTPMSWGIAAFRDPAAAPGPTLAFDALRKALP